MYKYAVTLSGGYYYEFESSLHINVLNVMEANGAKMVYFYDCHVALNINHIEKLTINGIEHSLVPIASLNLKML